MVFPETLGTIVRMGSLERLNKTIPGCRKCPRLVKWRERVAGEKTRRFSEWDYWGKPLPGFGDPSARLWVVGLAPAAHGGNRTGRIFTGDRSGHWLFRALYKAGFASQSRSVSREDGMILNDCYISAVVRCAPPGNKPKPQEFDNCRPYLAHEFRALENLQVILCLGQISMKQTLTMLEGEGFGPFKPKPKFAHGLEFILSNDIVLTTSYHPSQRNTFTGLLTERMFDEIFTGINHHLS